VAAVCLELPGRPAPPLVVSAAPFALAASSQSQTAEHKPSLPRKLASESAVSELPAWLPSILTPTVVATSKTEPSLAVV
jgi:hypothetical protein